MSSTRWKLRFRLLLAVALLAGFAIPASVHAQIQRERTAQAESLVEQALRSGGETGLDRTMLLQAAADLAPRFAPARWHAGQIRIGDEWLSCDDAAQLLNADSRVVEYREKRELLGKGALTQEQLARWCDERGLTEQAKTHWTLVLDTQPNHEAARARLGFRWVEGAWIEGNRVETAVAARDDREENLARWTPRIEALRRGLTNRALARRNYALEELAKIDDPAAIPALEEVLIARGGASALAAVRTIGQMDAISASRSLAALAAFAESDDVRSAAAALLKGRPQSHYVPMLLDRLYTPLQTRSEIERNRAGKLTYRQVLYREGREMNEVSATEVRLQRDRAPNDVARAALAMQTWREKTRDKRPLDSIVEVNEQTRQTNARVCAVLRSVTGQQIADEPTQWWKWWNEQNEIIVSGEKPAKQLFRRDQFAVLNRSADLSIPKEVLANVTPRQVAPQFITDERPSPRLGKECLAAGTPVWTMAGKQAIETIQPGDLVLSQHPQTGELAYKAVLRTTVRPAERLVRVWLGTETLVTSGGHVFWSVGEGWTRSRVLSDKQQLHALGGAVAVLGTEPAQEAETYNLIVADFHTYFAGETKVLSHDNTSCQPVDQVVPGLAKK